MGAVLGAADARAAGDGATPLPPRRGDGLRRGGGAAPQDGARPHVPEPRLLRPGRELRVRGREEIPGVDDRRRAGAAAGPPGRVRGHARARRRLQLPDADRTRDGPRGPALRRDRAPRPARRRGGVMAVQMRATTLRDTAIDSVAVSAYTVPTEQPEADGTLQWDSTTVVVAEP